MIPEQGRFMLQIVFGKDERAKVEKMRQELSEGTRKAYDEATTYHDGKWLLLGVDNEETLADVERLLVVKRRPHGEKK
jgi:DNA-binding transcriptional regulator PaaX